MVNLLRTACLLLGLFILPPFVAPLEKRFLY